MCGIWRFNTCIFNGIREWSSCSWIMEKIPTLCTTFCPKIIFMCWRLCTSDYGWYCSYALASYRPQTDLCTLGSGHAPPNAPQNVTIRSLDCRHPIFFACPVKCQKVILAHLHSYLITFDKVRRLAIIATETMEKPSMFILGFAVFDSWCVQLILEPLERFLIASPVTLWLFRASNSSLFEAFLIISLRSIHLVTSTKRNSPLGLSTTPYLRVHIFAFFSIAKYSR